MPQHMYIDESGDPGQRGSKFMVIAALVVDTPQELDRIIKNMRRNKFRKQLKKASEIKANKSSKALIKYMLGKLGGVFGAQVFCIVLEKKKIFSSYLLRDKHKLYNYVAGKLASGIRLDTDLEIHVDKCKSKRLLREDFNDYFLVRLQKDSLYKSKLNTIKFPFLRQ